MVRRSGRSASTTCLAGDPFHLRPHWHSRSGPALGGCLSNALMQTKTAWMSSSDSFAASADSTSAKLSSSHSSSPDLNSSHSVGERGDGIALPVVLNALHPSRRLPRNSLREEGAGAVIDTANSVRDSSGKYVEISARMLSEMTFILASGEVRYGQSRGRAGPNVWGRVLYCAGGATTPLELLATPCA